MSDDLREANGHFSGSSGPWVGTASQQYNAGVGWGDTSYTAQQKVQQLELKKALELDTLIQKNQMWERLNGKISDQHKPNPSGATVGVFLKILFWLFWGFVFVFLLFPLLLGWGARSMIEENNRVTLVHLSSVGLSFRAATEWSRVKVKDKTVSKLKDEWLSFPVDDFHKYFFRDGFWTKRQLAFVEYMCQKRVKIACYDYVVGVLYFSEGRIGYEAAANEALLSLRKNGKYFSEKEAAELSRAIKQPCKECGVGEGLISYVGGWLSRVI